MKKKVLALFMAAMMGTTILSGCSEKNSSQSETKGTEVKTEAQEETEEIVFAYMTQNNIPETSELQRIEDLLNEYTVEKINTKVKLVLFSNADYMNQVNLMLAAGEKLDLFKAQNTSYIPYIKDGTALDITPYLEKELKETVETVYNGMLKPTTVDGKTYGIIAMGSNYVPGGFVYRSDIVEELGIDMTQVNSFEEMTDVFAAVKAAYPDMIIIDPNRANALFEGYLGKVSRIDPLGDKIDYTVSGVAYVDGEPKVQNMYELDDFITLCNMTRSWYQAGYFASDAATTTATTAELLMSGNCFGTFCGLGNPNIAKTYAANYGYPFENVQLCESLVWGGSDSAWMVNSSSDVPAAACKFMNLLYTDAYVDNLLIYGEEGVDYQLNEEGFAVPPEGYTDLNSVKYTNNMNYYLWGNKWLAYPVPGGLNGEALEKQIEKNYAGELSSYYGFLFDYSSLEAEYTACLNIVNEYKKSLWVGAADVEETLKELNGRLESAGVQKLIDLKQEQLNEWESQQK